jgi:hypothetical protein
MTLFLRTAVGFATLMLLVVLPLAVFISRSRAKVNIALYWVVLYPAWYLSTTVFHEGAHYFAATFLGVQVKAVRLVPQFWHGDFADAYVNTGPWTAFQAGVVSTAPYWSSVIWVACGLLILRRLRGTPLLLASLVLTVFCLRPLADLVNNYFGVVVFRFGDFRNAAGALGYPLMHLLALSLLAVTLAGCVYGVYGTVHEHSERV